MNLALHECDVVLDESTGDVDVRGVGVVVRRGIASLIPHDGSPVEHRLAVTSIEEVSRQRTYRLVGPEGTWLVRRVGGCRTCTDDGFPT